MNDRFDIDGTLLATVGPQSGISLKTEGAVADLPSELQTIVLKLLQSPELYQNKNFTRQPDEGKYNLEIETGRQKFDYYFSDFHVPDEVEPLINYLRKKAFTSK
jgi:hypothetical protein